MTACDGQERLIPSHTRVVASTGTLARDMRLR
jgi:hypothetical protein